MHAKCDNHELVPRANCTVCLLMEGTLRETEERKKKESPNVKSIRQSIISLEMHWGHPAFLSFF